MSPMVQFGIYCLRCKKNADSRLQNLFNVPFYCRDDEDAKKYILQLIEKASTEKLEADFTLFSVYAVAKFDCIRAIHHAKPRKLFDIDSDPEILNFIKEVKNRVSDNV